MASSFDPAALIDTARYPVDRLSSPEGRALVAACREQLAAEGAANLNGFIRAAALPALVGEAEALLPDALVKRSRRNLYVKPVDSAWPDDHPGRQILEATSSQIAYDQIPESTLLRRLFLWDGLTEFIGAALGKARLHRFADPFQALNLIYLRAGDSTGWHFDHNESTVTLLLQAPEAGGDFEYAPHLRAKDDDNLEGQRRLLAGDRRGVRSLERGAGTLTIFLGEYSAHRVTPVVGPQCRITAIMTYDDEPDRVSTDEANILVYGARAAAIIARRKGGAPAT